MTSDVTRASRPRVTNRHTAGDHGCDTKAGAGCANVSPVVNDRVLAGQRKMQRAAIKDVVTCFKISIIRQIYMYDIMTHNMRF